MSEENERVTELLIALRDGHEEAFDELFPRVYGALKERARQQRRNWEGDFTLNTTSLVHEVYLRLVKQRTQRWESRAHFYAVASRAMRRILIDYARYRRAQKRGGSVQKGSLPEEDILEGGAELFSDERVKVLLALDEALRCLEREDARRGQVVECRFFGNMTIEETAHVLGVSRNTVKRDWLQARAWLYRELKNVLPELEGDDP